MALADSLDRIGSLYNDTAALRKAAGDLCALNHRTEKAKALYYLGRNYSLANLDATAVDCYIAADRLRPQDSQLRGRLNGNMAYICAQQKRDSLAVIFFDRCARFYKECGDSIKYAYALLNKSYSYVVLQNFEEADNLWKESASIANNELFISQLWVYRAYYHNCLGEYDLSLESVNKGQKSPDKSYLYWQYAMSHYYLGNTDSSAYYAEKLIQISSNAAHVMDAYFFLGQKAERDEDIKKVAYYADKRNDWEYIARQGNNQRILAISKIEQYLKNPYDKMLIYAGLFIAGLLIIVVTFFLLFVFYRRKHRKVSQHKDNILSEQDLIIRQLHQSATDSQRERLLASIKEHVNKDDLLHSLHWKDEKQMIVDINLYMFGFADRIHKYPNVTIENIRIYVLCLLNCSQKEMAQYLHKSEKSIKNIKARAAKKIGSTSAELHRFLLDFICEPID